MGPRIGKITVFRMSGSGPRHSRGHRCDRSAQFEPGQFVVPGDPGRVGRFERTDVPPGERRAHLRDAFSGFHWQGAADRRSRTPQRAAPGLIHGAAAGMCIGWRIAESSTGAGSGRWRCCGCRPGSSRRRWCGSCRRRGRRGGFQPAAAAAADVSGIAGPGSALRPAAGARLPARVAARIPACSRLGLDHARCGDSGGDGGGGAARSDRDRALRDSVQPSRVGGLVVARTPRLTAPRRLRAGQERIWYAGGVPAGPAAHCP